MGGGSVSPVRTVILPFAMAVSHTTFAAGRSHPTEADDYEVPAVGYLSDMPDRPTRVVLANDDPIVIEGLRAMLAPYEERVVITGVAVGDPQIEMAPITDGEADVLLIDAFSRAAGGIDAAVKILAQDPPFVVGVFTDAGDTRLMLQALRVGVRGYILKSTSAADLVDALVRLRTGEVVIDPRLATDAAVLAARSIDLGDWPGAHLGLTRREAELLALLGEGLAPRAAADRMNLSPETVRTHTRNLYRKLNVNDRAAAVAVAWREGLVH
jgi:DNA-binding NarL/FixJ family response regulator